MVRLILSTPCRWSLRATPMCASLRSCSSTIRRTYGNDDDYGCKCVAARKGAVVEWTRCTTNVYDTIIIMHIHVRTSGMETTVGSWMPLGIVRRFGFSSYTHPNGAMNTHTRSSQSRCPTHAQFTVPVQRLQATIVGRSYRCACARAGTSCKHCISIHSFTLSMDSKCKYGG